VYLVLLRSFLALLHCRRHYAKLQVPERIFRKTAGPADPFFGVRQGLRPILLV